MRRSAAQWSVYGALSMATATRILYALGIGIFVVLTVGFGTVAFFPDPDRTEDRFPAPIPAPARPIAPDGSLEAAPLPREASVEASDRDAWEAFEDARGAHRRRVLIGATLTGGILLLGALTAATAPAVLRIGVIIGLRLGVIIGGLFTLLWAFIYTGEHAGNTALFVAALVVLLLLAALTSTGIRARLHPGRRGRPSRRQLEGVRQGEQTGLGYAVGASTRSVTGVKVQAARLGRSMNSLRGRSPWVALTCALNLARSAVSTS